MKEISMARRRRARGTFVAIGWSVVVTVLAAADSVSAQAPGGCNTPVSQRTSKVGCYFTVSELMDALPPGPLFWHLYHYPSRTAAKTAKGLQGTIAESFGKVWLYTIANADWRPSDGERVAVIGPLPITPAKQYTARYMEALFPPGMQGVRIGIRGRRRGMCCRARSALRRPKESSLCALPKAPS